MNHYIKKTLSTLLASTLALSLAVPAGATDALDLDTTLFQSDNQLETVTNSTQYSDDYYSFYQTYGAANAATVFYNGEEIGFHTAYPLIKDGTTFVPLSVFSNVIGSDIRYIPETHSVELQYKGDTITFDIGETGFSVNGGPEEHLPNPTFVIDGYTLVPVRFITAAFDLDLYWNGSYNQVIVADLDTLKEGITTNYTLMDSLLSLVNTQEPGKNMALSGNFEYTITTEGKDMVLLSDLDVIANQDGSAVNYYLDATVDLDDYHNEIQALLASLDSPEEVATLESALLSLNDFTVHFLYDLDNFDVYLKSSLLVELAPIYLGISHLTLKDDTWFKLSLSDFMLDSEMASLQNLIHEAMDMESITDMDILVDTMMTMTTQYDNRYVDVFGGLRTLLNCTKDDYFTPVENRYLLSDVVELGNQWIDFNLTLSTSDAGAVTGYELTVQQEESAYQSLRFTITQPHEEKIFFAMDAQLFEIELDLVGEFDLQSTYSQAEKVPGSGTIIDVYDLLS